MTTSRPTTPKKPRTLRFYFNLRSPYSWLATHDLSSRYPDVAAAVEWHPFWEPGNQDQQWLSRAGGSFPYRAMSREKHLYILQDVRRLAQQRGLEIRWPVDTEPRWEVAHHPFFVAHEDGLGREYVQRIGRARWEEGRDISDPDVVAAVGAELGLDPARLCAAVDSADVENAATEALRRIDHDGVFGVPFFTAGQEKFWGVDRLAPFAETARRKASLGDPLPTVSLATVGAAAGFDDGHAGGCG